MSSLPKGQAHPSSVKIALVLASLGYGGAERVACILANEWHRRSLSVAIITFFEGVPAYELDRGIERIVLGSDFAGATNRISRNLVLAGALRHALVSLAPNVVVSFVDTTNVITLLASLRLNIPVIVAERNNTERYTIPAPWRLLRWLCYRFAAGLVVQSQRGLAGVPRPYFGSCRVIPNPVLPATRQLCSSREPPKGPRVMAMGRLVEQKGFDMLLRAFARTGPRHSHWSLVIFGEGPERDRLQAMVRDLTLEHRVFLPGITPDPMSELSASDLFVLSSRFEGFPNALCEAMSCGVPVVSFDCPFGPREIINDGVDGVLVPENDVSGLAEAMDRLMGDKSLREKLGDAGRAVANRLSAASVAARWSDYLLELVNRGRNESDGIVCD